MGNAVIAVVDHLKAEIDLTMERHPIAKRVLAGVENLVFQDSVLSGLEARLAAANIQIVLPPTPPPAAKPPYSSSSSSPG